MRTGPAETALLWLIAALAYAAVAVIAWRMLRTRSFPDQWRQDEGDPRLQKLVARIEWNRDLNTPSAEPIYAIRLLFLHPVYRVLALHRSCGNIARVHGCTTRAEFWWTAVWVAVLNAAVVFALAWMVELELITFSVMASAANSVVWLSAPVLLVPSAVRRMHDTGRPGWWVLVPIVNIVFLMKRSGPWRRQGRPDRPARPAVDETAIPDHQRWMYGTGQDASGGRCIAFPALRGQVSCPPASARSAVPVG